MLAMKDFHDLNQQIISGVFTFVWILLRPFVWVYLFLKWFIVSTTKEAGNRMVKIVGGMIAVGIVAYVIQFFTLKF